MAKSQAAVATVPDEPAPALSPERAALAEAHAAVAAARRTRDAARETEAHGAARVAEAEAEVAAAEIAIAAARAAHATAMTTAAIAGTTAAPSTDLRLARARHGDALDQLDAARESFGALKGKLSGAEATLWHAKQAVKPAEGAILRPAIPRLIAEIQATRAAMVAKHYELIFLKRAVSERRAANEYSLPAEQSAAMDFLNSNMRLPADDGCYWPGWKEIETEVAATWGDAIAALAADPSAELPR